MVNSNFQSSLTSIDTPFNVFTIPDLSTQGYIQVDPVASVVGNAGVITLTGGCYTVTAGTEINQAQSIIDGLTGTVNIRPNTHDLLKDTLENLDVEILRIKIVDIKENNFIGNLIIKQGGKILNLDSKPSDGIALAVRTGTPIYMKEELMIEYGENIC